MHRRLFRMILATSFAAFISAAVAQDQNTLPKYGSVPKSEALKASDAVFITGMDKGYNGDRQKASADMAMRGWQYLQSGDPDDGMRRFNQAWLLDSHCGLALWGMAAVESDRDHIDESLKLFAEAEPHVGKELNFAIDYARAIAVAGAARKNSAMIDDANKRFAKLYKQAPQNTRNLQNWAKALFADGKYPEAWDKVKLAEATPDGKHLDPTFITALQAAMPRPQ